MHARYICASPLAYASSIRINLSKQKTCGTVGGSGGMHIVTSLRIPFPYAGKFRHGHENYREAPWSGRSVDQYCKRLRKLLQLVGK